jgi:hypothetical protein
VKDVAMKNEIVMSLASEGQQGRELAPLEKLARRLEDALDESVAQEDVVCAIVRLAVPDLANYCLVDVFDGEHPVCCVFAHHDPTSTVALGEHKHRRPPLPKI